MKIKYFKDTDTAFIEFASVQVAEIRELNENVYMDLDASGNLVSMTIEHARACARLPEIEFSEYDRAAG
ncbi:MAG: DUF2283 domain-containing protein [Pseudomonadales bacterium]